LSRITWLSQPLDRDQPDKKLWSGTISADTKTLGSRLKHKSFKEYLDSVNKYYYQITPAAHVRCIDGRKSKHVAEVNGREELLAERLGPQSAGGSPVGALSHRIAEWDERPQANIIDDTVSTINLYSRLGLPSLVGAHDDDHAEFPNTGCGAIDRMPEILERIVDPKSEKIVRYYSQAIVGEGFDDEQFDVVMDRFRQLESDKGRRQYLLEKSNGQYEYKKQTLDALRTHNPKSVETMSGGHREFAVVINKHKGTTFHRDLFCWDSGNEAQIFNYDHWLSEERANYIYTDSPTLHLRFLISGAMYAVGTCMVLTDGSLAVGIRQ